MLKLNFILSHKSLQHAILKIQMNFLSVTPLNMHYLNPAICAICIFYTTIGGLKAVVWTDTLQFSVMIGAIVTVLVMGIKAVGGIDVVWERALEGERLDIE